MASSWLTATAVGRAKKMSLKTQDTTASEKRKWTLPEGDSTKDKTKSGTDLAELFVDAPLTDEEDAADENQPESEASDDEAGEADSAEEDDGQGFADEESSEYSGLSEGEEADDSSDDESSPVLYSLGSPKPASKSGASESSASAQRPDPAQESANVASASSSSQTGSAAKLTDPHEYDLDSSDEEDLRNTVGNIPMEWYEDYPHIGYDVDGKRIYKPAKGDELDNFLKRMDDPDFGRTVKDKLTGQSVVLTDEDVDVIQKLQGEKLTGAGSPYEPFEDIFSHEVMKTSLSSRPPTKRSFIPSLLEKEKISKLVHAIKMGWIKLGKPKEESAEEEDDEKFYALWEKEEEDAVSKSQRARKLNHVPAPKLTLPGHAESYNPPPEYLLTDEEKKKWRSEDPEDRKLDFVPKQYKAMRVIPGWNRLIKERFERCLDLYLCPRQRKMKVNVDPEDLIPTLPKPKDLQPFPSQEALVYRGHSGVVRCLSVHSSGQFLASGSDDKTVRIWEISTGRCFKTYTFEDRVSSLSWSPKHDVCLLVATVEKSVFFLNPEIGDKLIASNTDHLLENLGRPDSENLFATFRLATEAEKDRGIRLSLLHSQSVVQISWHPKGDYLATVAADGPSSQVIMHQLSKLRSQMPFKRLTMVQRVMFHPTKPFLFVCSQRAVRIYDLSKQELKKTLQPSCQFISCAAIHPQGDNVLVGSYDHRLCWFDLDASVKPYQTLRHHNKAVRQVTFHRRYPLFASCSDDGSVIICHGMVYNDLNQFPLIVPVRVLKGHGMDAESGLGVLDIQFHPTQPWVFSAGADKTIRLYA